MQFWSTCIDEWWTGRNVEIDDETRVFKITKAASFWNAMLWLCSEINLIKIKVPDSFQSLKGDRSLYFVQNIVFYFIYWPTNSKLTFLTVTTSTLTKKITNATHAHAYAHAIGIRGGATAPCLGKLFRIRQFSAVFGVAEGVNPRF